MSERDAGVAEREQPAGALHRAEEELARVEATSPVAQPGTPRK